MPFQNVSFRVHLSFNFTEVLAEKYPLPFSFDLQRYQQVVDKLTQRSVQNPGRAVAAAATNKFRSKATTAIFDDIIL